MPVEVDYSKTAWGDESVRMHTDPPMYLLGACVFDNAEHETFRNLENLKPKGAGKLHWRELSINDQSKSLELIAALPHTTSIVVASPLEKNKQERARRKCLELLLAHLDQKGIELLVLESRDSHLDRLDNVILFAMRQSRTIFNIDVRHSQGQGEPRLYVPDQILGAYGDVTAHNQSSQKWQPHWENVRNNITELNVRL